MNKLFGMTIVALALGLTQGLPGSIPTASAATAVVCGTVSSADKEQLKLTGDLYCAGTAVKIIHNKVHFDLAGFTLTGTGVGNGIDVGGGACVPTARVHINGGTVTGFEHGILLCNATKSHINGITAIANDLSGIKLDRSDNNQINGSSLIANGTTNIGGASTDGGLVLFNSDNNKIHTMTIEDSIAFGVLFRFSGGNTITSSVLTNNNINSIFLDRSGGNTVRGNTIEGPSVQGINMNAGGGDDTIVGNTITNIGSVGIKIRSVRNAVVRGNTVNDNGNIGIQLVANSFDNLLQSNTALGNGADLTDSNAAAAPLPCNNVWKDNTFATKTDPGGCIQ